MVGIVANIWSGSGDRGGPDIVGQSVHSFLQACRLRGADQLPALFVALANSILHADSQY